MKKNEVEKPLISIIVPVYNVEKFIDLCTESIVKQTYNNIEIILVDDGSTDRSSNICDIWKNRDKRIKVIHKKNGGLSDARNTGLEIAKGSYITFIDSDDILNVHTIEILYRNMVEQHADLSVCEFVKFEDGMEKIDYYENVVTNNLSVYNNKEKFDNLYNKKKVTTTVAWNKIYKRELFDSIRFPKGKFHEDVFVAHHILDKAQRIVYTDAVLYYYCQRSGSITSNFSLKKLDEVAGYKDRMDFFCENYKNTKYAELSAVEYGDNLIAMYIFLNSNNVNKEYNKAIKGLKERYNQDYKFIKKMTNNKYKKMKYTIFKKNPRLFCILHMKK